MKDPGLFGIVWQDAVFSNLEIQSIHDLVQDIKQNKKTKVDQNRDMSASKRVSETNWIDYTEYSKWIYKRIQDVALDINQNFYGFDVSGIQPFQYTVYKDTVQGNYPWHRDLTLIGDFTSIRKLSLSILLSDTADYSGGRFLFAPDGNRVEIEQKQGRLIVFPSWTPHSISPVLSGTRISLVSWLHGKKFI
jgi:PKHD-type hydroxylase